MRIEGTINIIMPHQMANTDILRRDYNLFKIWKVKKSDQVRVKNVNIYIQILFRAEIPNCQQVNQRKR